MRASCKWLLFLLFGFVACLFLYLWSMPRSSVRSIAFGEMVTAKKNTEYKITASGYNELDEIQLIIKWQNKSKREKIILSSTGKRYSSPGGAIVDYAVVINSVRESLSIPDDVEFNFTIEWTAPRKLDIVLHSYSR